MKMERRGQATLKEIVVWIILLVVLLFVILSGTGLIQKIGKWFGDYSDKVFTDLGLKKNAEVPNGQVDQTVKAYFESLYRFLAESGGGTDCILTYPHQPDLGNYRIEILGTTDKGLTMSLVDGSGKQVDFLPVTGKGPDLVPCIIAGNQEQSLNFYGCKITGPASYCSKPMFSSSGSIILWSTDSLSMDGVNYYIPASSILYRFDSRHACFITLDKGALPQYTEKGLADEAIQNVIGLPKCK